MIPTHIKKLLSEKLYTQDHLDLSNYGLDDADMSELEALLEDNKNITSIDLEHNNITSKGLNAIASISSVKKINVSQNKINDEGIIFLLKNNTTLESICIRNNALSEIGGEAILDKIKKNENIKYVAVDGNKAIKNETIDEIKLFFSKKIKAEKLGIIFDKPIIDLSKPYRLSFIKEEKPVNPEISLLAKKIVKEHSSEVKEMTEHEKETLIKDLISLLDIKSFKDKLNSSINEKLLTIKQY
jgi:hypothetical protein